MEPSKTNSVPSSTPDASLRIRFATPEDADGIRAVYAPYLHTPITFEEELPSPEAFRARIADIVSFYPCLVAEHNSRIIGYAYAHRQAEREAYGWNAELSVYLSTAAHGHGLGSLLYRTLIELVRMQGVKCAYALVTIPNAASERLHETLGFHLMGTQRNAGYTCASWRDVAWYTLPLSSFDADPAPVVAFRTLGSPAVCAVVENTNREIASHFDSRSSSSSNSGLSSAVDSDRSADAKAPQ
ncbi:MAG: N-acetyltransferase family protein [Gordonibacter sp.]|nr:N-acetyltransferase family protein [Gordonibacter sp.]